MAFAGLAPKIGNNQRKGGDSPIYRFLPLSDTEREQRLRKGTLR